MEISMGVCFYGYLLEHLKTCSMPEIVKKNFHQQTFNKISYTHCFQFIYWSLTNNNTAISHMEARQPQASSPLKNTIIYLTIQPWYKFIGEG